MKPWTVPAEFPLIDVVEGRMGGYPCIAGTRVPFDIVARLCGDGTIPFEDVENFYHRVSPEAARQAWAFAHQRWPRTFPAF